MDAARLRRAWYYARSFFRRRWTLRDYPVDVRLVAVVDENAAPDAGATAPQTYMASIDGMHVFGQGATPDAARSVLAENFETYRAAHDTLPRPGTQQPIEFASSERVEAHGALLDDFVERVLKLPWAFISDQSSLREFPEEFEEYNRRIMLLYGVDVDTLADDRIATILDALAGAPP